MSSDAVRSPTPLKNLAGSPTVRRVFVIVLLAALWEGYGRFLNDDLLFPSLSKTLVALFDSTRTG